MEEEVRLRRSARRSDVPFKEQDECRLASVLFAVLL